MDKAFGLFKELEVLFYIQLAFWNEEHVFRETLLWIQNVPIKDISERFNGHSVPVWSSCWQSQLKGFQHHMQNWILQQRRVELGCVGYVGRDSGGFGYRAGTWGCERLWEVLEAPRAFHRFFPCLPVDVATLALPRGGNRGLWRQVGDLLCGSVCCPNSSSLSCRWQHAQSAAPDFCLCSAQCLAVGWLYLTQGSFLASCLLFFTRPRTASAPVNLSPRQASCLLAHSCRSWGSSCFPQINSPMKYHCVSVTD